MRTCTCKDKRKRSDKIRGLFRKIDKSNTRWKIETNVLIRRKQGVLNSKRWHEGAKRCHRMNKNGEKQKRRGKVTKDCKE